MDLGKQLNLISSGKVDSFDLELAGVDDDSIFTEEIDNDNIELSKISIDRFIKPSSDKKKKTKKKEEKKTFLLDDFDETVNDKKSRIEKITEKTKILVTNAELATSDDFDEFLDNDDIWYGEEDAELHNSLISIGRKYARDNSVSKESSEITKTFADSEKRLDELYKELDKDKNGITRDIDKLRMPQRGNSKALSEIIAVRTSIQNTQLSIIKEINSLRKTKYDLRNKELAKKEAENGNNDINPNTLQSIFSSTRNSLISGMGGYGNVSGAVDHSPESSALDVYDNDEMIQRKYFSDNNDESDGDKFLKYEGRGVEYVAILDGNKVVDVMAEDNEGNIITDYPLPDIEDLSFTVDFSTKTAKDSLHRNYKIRE